MKFQGALIREQGIEFAIVIVKKHVIDNPVEANKAIASFQQIFAARPVVLMAQNFRGVPEYYGRRDIVRFLARVPPSAIRWKEYTLN